MLNSVHLMEHNDIVRLSSSAQAVTLTHRSFFVLFQYSWLTATLAPRDQHPDLKINLIFPATATHIAKYTRQKVVLLRETPELYKSIVQPFIDAFPASRTEWFGDSITRG